MNILVSCSNNQKSTEHVDYGSSSISTEETSNDSNIHNSTNYISDEDEEAQISEQNNLYERTNGTKDVEACNDRTWECYDIEAEVSDWEVEQINFANWWHLDLDWASLDEDWEANWDSYTESEWSDWDSWSISCDDC